MKFVVQGKPFGKQRPRHNKKTGITYTPAKTKRVEKTFSDEYKKQCGGFRFQKEDYISLKIVAYYQIPTSATKNKKQQMIAGYILPSVKPDIDNVAKTVLDSLNHVAYDDDKQIVFLSVEKKYSLYPKTEVYIDCLKTVV